MSQRSTQPSFKGIMKKGVQQQPVNQLTRAHESGINKKSSTPNLFLHVTNQLKNQSQHFQPGDFRKNQPVSIPISKKRTSIVQMQCEQDIQPPIQYYGGGTQRSMLHSNIAESLFQSKLHETKGELCQQINLLQRNMRKEIQKDRGLIQEFVKLIVQKFVANIVSQLNTNLNTSSKKQKILENGLSENQQKLSILQKQFTDFSLQTEEKLQKIMNSNSEVANSMRRSMSRNIGNGDYMVQLKNSIKQIPVLNNGLVEEIRGQIHDAQQAIKSMRFQLTYLKQDLKSKTFAPAQIQKSKPQLIEATKINMVIEEINNIKNELQYLETQDSSSLRYKQLRNILEVQEQNYIGINDAFQKAVNTNIIPRIKKVQDQVQSQSLQKTTQLLKKQVIKQLESMPIIRVKSLTEEQKEKMDRMKNLPKSQQQVYMLDDLNYILDCFGNYLLDENNQRIKLQQDQIYYLEQVEGIQLKMPIDVK